MGLKIRLAFLLILIFLLIATVVANCSGGGGVAPSIPGDTDPDPTDDYYDPSEKLVEVDNLDMVLTDVTDDIYTFSYTGVSPDINPGDILTGSANGGYLRGVLSLIDSGNSLVITTQQSTIDDALKGARISANIDFSKRTNQNSRNANPNSSGYVIPLTGEIIYSDDTTTISFHDGEIIYMPLLDVNMKYDISKGLNYFKAVAMGNMTFDFDMKVTGTGDFDITAEKLIHSSAPIPFHIGPIWGSVVLDLYAGVDFDGYVQDWLKSGIDAEVSVESGAEYKNSTWTQISAVNYSFLPGTMLGTVDGPVTFNGYVRPEATILFASIETPSISAMSDFLMNGTGQLAPDCLTYDLSAGLNVEVAVLPDILGDNLPSYSEVILDINELVESGSVGECTSCADLTVGNISGADTIESEGVALFSCEASGDTGILYSWSCVPETAGEFTSPYSDSTEFQAYAVTADTNIAVKVLITSDSCPDGIIKSHNVEITVSNCSYTISNIMGPDLVLGLHSEFYSINVAPYSITGLTYNWSCNPPSAGYFLSNDARMIEFFANPVLSQTNVNLELEVESDECDPINRSKEITVDKENVGQ